MIIDFSCHLLSKETLKITEKKRFYGGKQGQYHIPQESTDPVLRSRLMDSYGIDVHVLSFSAGGLRGMSPKEASKLCKIANDSVAEFIGRMPSRYTGLSVISLLDVEAALEELDRAMGLGFSGAIIGTNQGGIGLHERRFDRFYARMEKKYDAPILLHPTDWLDYPLATRDIMTVFGWPFDTTQAMANIIFGGVLDRHPDLKFVMHHLGAMLPFFASRLTDHVKLVGRESKLKRKKISEYWRNIYGDTAIDGNKASFACGYSFFGPDRMVYGTDYPFGTEQGNTFIKNNLEGVRAMGLPQIEESKILGGNAKNLLKLKL